MSGPFSRRLQKNSTGTVRPPGQKTGLYRLSLWRFSTTPIDTGFSGSTETGDEETWHLEDNLAVVSHGNAVIVGLGSARVSRAVPQWKGNRGDSSKRGLTDR